MTIVQRSRLAHIFCIIGCRTTVCPGNPRPPGLNFTRQVTAKCINATTVAVIRLHWAPTVNPMLAT